MSAAEFLSYHTRQTLSDMKECARQCLPSTCLPKSPLRKTSHRCTQYSTSEYKEIPIFRAAWYSKDRLLPPLHFRSHDEVAPHWLSHLGMGLQPVLLPQQLKRWMRREVRRRENWNERPSATVVESTDSRTRLPCQVPIVSQQQVTVTMQQLLQGPWEGPLTSLCLIVEMGVIITLPHSTGAG